RACSSRSKAWMRLSWTKYTSVHIPFSSFIFIPPERVASFHSNEILFSWSALPAGSAKALFLAPHRTITRQATGAYSPLSGDLTAHRLAFYDTVPTIDFPLSSYS